jgi:hypothetical protein
MNTMKHSIRVWTIVFVKLLLFLLPMNTFGAVVRDEESSTTTIGGRHNTVRGPHDLKPGKKDEGKRKKCKSSKNKTAETVIKLCGFTITEDLVLPYNLECPKSP